MVHHTGCVTALLFGCILTLWTTYFFTDMDRVGVAVPKSFRGSDFDLSFFENDGNEGRDDRHEAEDADVIKSRLPWSKNDVGVEEFKAGESKLEAGDVRDSNSMSLESGTHVEQLKNNTKSVENNAGRLKIDTTHSKDVSEPSKLSQNLPRTFLQTQKHEEIANSTNQTKSTPKTKTVEDLLREIRNKSGTNEKDEENDGGKAKGQTIEKRRSCYKRAFTEKMIKKVNSDSLPPSPIPLEQICQGNDTDNCVPSFVPIQQKATYFPARTIKTASCMVHKSMSTIFKTLSCFFNDPIKFLVKKNNLLSYGDKIGCDKYYTQQNKFGSIAEGEERFQISDENDWQYAMIVRDPVERFLSGYLHMCYYGQISTCARYCNNCGANLTCFLEREVESMMNVAKTGEINDTKTSHMIPQSWQCELSDHFSRYQFIRYYSNSAQFVDQSLAPFLQQRNVSSDTISYIRERLTSARTKHSTSNSSLKPFLEERIRGSPYLMSLLMRLFYNDYKTFGFEMPF